MKFDIGVECKFRFVGVEAPSGELARDKALTEFREWLGKDSALRIERDWFEPSAPLKPSKDKVLV